MVQRQNASSRCDSEFATKCLTCGTVIYTSGMLLLWLSLPGMLMGAFSEAVALGVIAAVPILLGAVLCCLGCPFKLSLPSRRTFTIRRQMVLIGAVAFILGLLVQVPDFPLVVMMVCICVIVFWPTWLWFSARLR